MILTCRQSKPLEKGLAYGTLQGGEAEPAPLISFQNELDAAVTKIADPIEQDDVVRRMVYFKL